MKVAESFKCPNTVNKVKVGHMYTYSYTMWQLIQVLHFIKYSASVWTLYILRPSLDFPLSLSYPFLQIECIATAGIL